MANYLRDAIRYQQEMEEANRPVTVNSLMARKAAAIKQNAPAENMLTQYAQTMPQNWQQFGQNMAQAYPTPATGASREQILSAVKQAAVNAGPLMTVFHGSPHMFDAFDASKIGTGEGAQAYGHGLYFAENPSVAESYKAPKAMGNLMMMMNDKANILSQKAFAQSGGDRAGAIALLKELEVRLPFEQRKETLDAIRGINNGSFSTNLYKVDLPDEHIAKMLDWDKPLSGQHPDVQAAIAQLHGKDALGRPTNAPPLNPEDRGQWLYQALQEGRTQKLASEALAKQGIPGIRYLDGGSRAGGQGTSNFVVFPGNEGLLKILERQ